MVAAPRPLLAFLLEQLLTNGLGAWLEWQAMHRVLWFVVVMRKGKPSNTGRFRTAGIFLKP